MMRETRGSPENGTDHSDLALRLREEFDRAFSLPAREHAVENADLLAIGLNGDGYALRVPEITGIAAGRKILPLPGAPAGLLGLSGIRGTLVPVWDLAALLGYGTAGVTPRVLRWLVLGPGDSPWALAFEEFQGYLRIPRSELHPIAGGGGAAAGTGPAGAGFARETCMVDGSLRKVIGMQDLLEAVKAITHSSRIRKG